MAILTGIDPGTHSIKIVQGQMAGPLFRLLRAVEIFVEPEGDPEVDILQKLQTDLPPLKLKKGVARLGVSGRELMIRYTHVPPVPIWRLKMLMDFEVADMASSSGEELIADYNLLHSFVDDGDETVLVALVKRWFLESRLRALGASGIDVQATTPNCVSLFNSFAAFGAIEDDEFTFLLDVGDQNLEMAIQKDGELLFARNLSGGGAAFTQAIVDAWGVGVPKARDLKHEYGNVTPRGRATYGSSQEEKVAMALMGVAGQLSGMVQSTINFARNQSGVRDLEIGRLLISGGGSSLKGLDAYLEQNLNLPVQRFVPDAGLDLSALPPDEAEVFEADPSAFACALGLARMSEDAQAFHIDLVPSAVKKKRRFLQRDLYMILSGVAALALLVLVFFDLRGEATAAEQARSQARRKERTAQAQRRRFDDRLEEARQLQNKVNELAWASRGGAYLLRAQALVQKHAPASMWVRSIRVSSKTLTPPGQSDQGKKKQTEKVVVEVQGEIRQLGEGVTTTYNAFVEALRGGAEAPRVETTRRPDDAGGAFEILIDYTGWPEPEGEDEEGDV